MAKYEVAFAIPTTKKGLEGYTKDEWVEQKTSEALEAAGTVTEYTYTTHKLGEYTIAVVAAEVQ